MVVLKDPSSAVSSDSTPTLTVTVDPEYQSGTVQLFSDSGCFTALSGTVTVNAAYEEVTTDPLTEGTYTIYTRHTSSGESVCTAIPVSYTYEGTAPTATIAPADGTVVADVETDIVFTFSEAVYRDRNSGLFDETSLAAVVVLKETNAGSADIAFSASISLDNRVVTVDPDADLPEGVVYAAVTGNFYDEVGNQGTAVSASFSVRVLSEPMVVLKDPSSAVSSDSTPTLTVTVDPEYQSGTVQLFSDSGCFTALSGAVTVDAAYEEVTTDPLTEGTYTIYTRHTSSGESVCTSVPVSYTYEESVYCRNGAPAAADPSRCKRGRFAIPGIDRIPLDMVKLTNREMQEVYVIADAEDWHIRNVGSIACNSYITEHDCIDRQGKRRDTNGTVTETTGSTPFTQLQELSLPNDALFHRDWLEPELRSMTSVKVVSYSVHPTATYYFINWNPDHLVVQAAGNQGNVFPLETKGGVRQSYRPVIHQAIADNKLLYVAGYQRDGDGNYRRHRLSNGCKGVDTGCLWTPLTFPDIGVGTSLSTPNASAALASVLSVFPDTGYQDLAKLAKACAKKTGEGIEEMLRDAGGVGVADFSCMEEITDAAKRLSSGGSAVVTVDGKTVTVTERKLTVR